MRSSSLPIDWEGAWRKSARSPRVIRFDCSIQGPRGAAFPRRPDPPGCRRTVRRLRSIRSRPTSGTRAAGEQKGACRSLIERGQQIRPRSRGTGPSTSVPGGTVTGCKPTGPISCPRHGAGSSPWPGRKHSSPTPQRKPGPGRRRHIRRTTERCASTFSPTRGLDSTVIVGEWRMCDDGVARRPCRVWSVRDRGSARGILPRG